MYTEQNYKEDKRISYSVMSVYVILMVQYLILIIFNLFDTSLGYTVQILSKIIVGIVFIINFRLVFKRNFKNIIIIYTIAIIIFFCTWIIFPLNRMVLKIYILPLFFMCIPSYLYISALKRIGIFYEVMIKSSKVILTVGFIVMIFILFKSVTNMNYYMAMSYYMLLPLIVFTNMFIFEENKKIIFFILLSLFIIIVFGSRGPLFSYLIYLFTSVIIKLKQKSKKNILKVILIIFFGILLKIFGRTILVAVNNFLLNNGIFSRTLYLLIYEIGHTSGRDYIYESTIKLIQSNYFFGCGIGGIRSKIDTYPHNIFLELLGQYGVFIGGLIIVLLICLLFNVLFIKNIKTNIINNIWFGIGFVPLLVSGSYLQDISFWIFIAIAIKSLNIKKYSEV